MSRLFKSVVLAAVIGSLAVSPAWADRSSHHGGGYGGGYGGGHGGHHGGGHRGGGWGGLGIGLLLGTAVYVAATSPPYHRPVTAVTVYEPPVYGPPPPYFVQSIPPAPPPREQEWWYYCSQPAGYHPYIRSCPTGWTRVAPTPPG